MLIWARTWVKNPQNPVVANRPAYDGLLIFRTDGGGNATAGYNGYATCARQLHRHSNGG